MVPQDNLQRHLHQENQQEHHEHQEHQHQEN